MANELVRATPLAAVPRALDAQGRQRGRSVSHPQGAERAGRPGGRAAPASSIVIDLPDLEENADIVIVGDNLPHALLRSRSWRPTRSWTSWWSCSRTACCRSGRAARHALRLLEEERGRLSEIERRNMYARCFGIPRRRRHQPERRVRRAVPALRLGGLVFVGSSRSTSSCGPRCHSQWPQVGHEGGTWGRTSRCTATASPTSRIRLRSQSRTYSRSSTIRRIKAAYSARDAFQLIDQVASATWMGGARNSYGTSSMAGAGPG